MLETYSDLEASAPVLEAKVADFQKTLQLPVHPLPPQKQAAWWHKLRRIPGLRRLTALPHLRRRGVLVTFDIHTLQSQSHFFMTSGGRHALVLMDCWPVNIPVIAKWCQQYGISDVFVSARQARDRLAALEPRIRWHWLPEGLPTAEYHRPDWADRPVDVLSFGRKHDAVHQRLIEDLPKLGLEYRYERKPFEVLFPTYEGFLQGLGDAKISICFPSSVTHPARSGDIETMTVRYLQSMASGCLIVGQSPQEMRDLFGYDPVVPLNLEEPAAHLQDLLRHPEQHEPLRQRNLETILANHTEIHRGQQIASVLGSGAVGGGR